MEPLEYLVKSVPEWQILLDDLNGKISKRQGELAEADDNRPPTRSMKNKGSTESLRPKDSDVESPLDIDTDMSPIDAPQLDNDNNVTNNSANAPALPPLFNAPPRPPPKPESKPESKPVQRNPSPRVKGAIAKGLPAPSPPVLRKRKTESLASAESGKPKNRTRSMIIVYYDSAVQIAFEELVKHISASRNSMRKGKMAARMAAMRTIAALEAEADDDESAADDRPLVAGGDFMSTAGYSQEIIAASVGDNDEDGLPLPALKFVSTRRMGPQRDLLSSKTRTSANRALLDMERIAMAGAAGRPGKGGHTTFCSPPPASPSANIFDELDSGLEWCQTMCEHAAHQFLREGRCAAEVQGIKSRLQEVRERAEREIAEAANVEKNVDGMGEGEGTEKGPSQRTNESADDVRMGDEGGVVKVLAQPKPVLPRTMRPIQIRKAGDKMPDKPVAMPSVRPVVKPVVKPVETVTKVIDGVTVSTMSFDTPEADDDVMGEDELRNEYAAIIARNSKYRR